MCLPLEMLTKELGMEKYCVFLIWVFSSLGIQEDLEFDVAFLLLGSKPSYE